MFREKLPLKFIFLDQKENWEFTLKQTQSEKGNVTMTSSHDIAVSSHPQIPSPTSWSSAEKRKRQYIIIAKSFSHLLDDIFSETDLYHIPIMPYFLLHIPLSYQVNQHKHHIQG